MKIKRTNTFKTNVHDMWQELEKVVSLRYVAFPMIVFRPERGAPMPEKWEPGMTYRFRLFVLGFFPLGYHVINLSAFRKDGHGIRSHEYGRFIKAWNHSITFHENSDGSGIEYTDEVDMDAGLWTVPVWLFARVFYAWRQYRWKKVFGPH